SIISTKNESKKRYKRRDTKEQNRQTQQKYNLQQKHNLLEINLLYLLTFCLYVPFIIMYLFPTANSERQTKNKRAEVFCLFCPSVLLYLSVHE
ncbi:hypothetical protein, partial [uncultured Duncaniella sp.]|uniref:hypothetical protein n=1 Tax=uncultured Duncaniella sp. TaxID=2768039 RepID=UPI00262A9166